MKKRIGSVLYNTENSVLVLAPDLFRKKNAFVFFRFDGNKITPVTIDEAEKLVVVSGNEDAKKYFVHQDKSGRDLGTIKISLKHIERLVAYCRENGLKQKDVIESFIDSLPVNK